MAWTVHPKSAALTLHLSAPSKQPDKYQEPKKTSRSRLRCEPQASRSSWWSCHLCAVSRGGITTTLLHPFNSPFSGTTQVSQYQKGKTNVYFTEARDSEWQWHQLGHMQVCTSLQTDNQRQHPTTHFFTGRMPFLPPNQKHQSTEGRNNKFWNKSIQKALNTLKFNNFYKNQFLWCTNLSRPQWI